jgi:hypothetical protein
VTPTLEFASPIVLDPGRKRPVLNVSAASNGSASLMVAQLGPAELVVRGVVEKKALVGGSRKEESTTALPVPLDGEITALKLDGRGEELFVGTSRGQLLWYDVRDAKNPTQTGAAKVGSARSPRSDSCSETTRSSPATLAERSRAGRSSQPRARVASR